MKIKIIFKITLTILVLVVSWYIYTLFNGSPFEKNRIKKELSNYLAEKYPFETVIREVDYSFKLSTKDRDYYDARAYIKNMPEIEFNVYPSTEKQKARDYLINTIWERSLEEKLIPHVKNNFWNKFKLITGVSNEKFTNEYISKSEIPSVYSIIGQLSVEVGIRIYVDKEFDNELDYQKMFEFINYLTEDEKINPRSLLFWFEDEQKHTNNKEFIKNFIRFELTETDIKSITNQNDLQKYKY